MLLYTDDFELKAVEEKQIQGELPELPLSAWKQDKIFKDLLLSSLPERTKVNYSPVTTSGPITLEMAQRNLYNNRY